MGKTKKGADFSATLNAALKALKEEGREEIKKLLTETRPVPDLAFFEDEDDAAQEVLGQYERHRADNNPSYN